MTNCDQVFERLTRGPFPAPTHGDAGEDAQVERHLRRCHACRRLAEALRPAVELFHEALEATDDLPRYDGGLIHEGVVRRSRRTARSPSSEVGIEPPVAGSIDESRRTRPSAESLLTGSQLVRARAERPTVALAGGTDGTREPGISAIWRRFREASLLTTTVAASVGVATLLASFAAPPTSDGSAAGARTGDLDWTRVARVVSDSQVREWNLPVACASVATRDAAAAGSQAVACCTACHAVGESTAAQPISQVAASGMRPALLLSSCATCHY